MLFCGGAIKCTHDELYLQPRRPHSIIMLFTAGDTELLQLNSRKFDFNLEFEQLFLSILPSAVFIVAASWRALSHARKPKVVHAQAFQYVKLVCILLHMQNRC